MSTENITPTEFDVLTGPRNGQRFFRHPGNKFFKAIVDSEQQRYRSTQSKQLKSALIDSIVERVHKADGRFLGTNASAGNGEWFVLSKRNTTDKIGHSLRERRNRKQSAKKVRLQHNWQEQSTAIPEPIHSWAHTAESFQRSKASLIDEEDDVVNNGALLQSQMPSFNALKKTSCGIPPPPPLVRFVSDDQEESSKDGMYFAPTSMEQRPVNNPSILCKEDVDWGSLLHHLRLS